MRLAVDDNPRAAFSEIVTPGEAAEPILAPPVRAALTEWLEEIWAEAALKEANLKPRRRAMFTGAAGTGKTTLAHHLSARLGYDMAIVRPDDVIGQYIGTGITNVGRIFKAAKQLEAASRQMDDAETPVVLFFDEFDTIAEKRMRSGMNRVGEHDHNATINALLAHLDAYQGVIIAATNSAKSIDASVWRRFDIQIELALPTQRERELILARYLEPYGMPAASLAVFSFALETATPALIRQFCETLKRQIVLGPILAWDMRKGPVLARVLASVGAHEDAGKPALWNAGGEKAIAAMPWPLPMACDVKDAPAPKPKPEKQAEVISLAKRKATS